MGRQDLLDGEGSPPSPVSRLKQYGLGLYGREECVEFLTMILQEWRIFYPVMQLQKSALRSLKDRGEEQGLDDYSAFHIFTSGAFQIIDVRSKDEASHHGQLRLK
jgi:hypothetical protein